MQTNERVERFKAEAAELNRKAGNQSKEGVLQAVGALMMIAGIVVSLIAFLSATGLEADGDIMEMIVLAIAMLAVSVAGAALFLRYSMARFLRFWLLRQMYEGQAHIDQVVEAIGQGGQATGADRTPLQRASS